MFLSELEPKERVAFLELAHKVANLDGHLTPAKEVLLLEYATEMNIEDYKVQYLSLDDILPYFSSERSKHIALTELLRLIFSDGVLHNAERKSVELIKKHFQFDPNEYTSFKDWVVKIKELSK